MISMTTNPQPGDLGFSIITGGRPSQVGWWVYLGQALIGRGCRFTHVYWIVNALDDWDHPDGRIIEALPGGAKYATLRDRMRPGHAIAPMPLSEAQRAMVAAIAEGFAVARGGRGVGYSFATYLAIELRQLRIPIPRLQTWIASRQSMICSQLVDEGLHRIGYQFFTDSRWRQDVTPADCYYQSDPRVIQPAPADVIGA